MKNNTKYIICVVLLICIIAVTVVIIRLNKEDSLNNVISSSESTIMIEDDEDIKINISESNGNFEIVPDKKDEISESEEVVSANDVVHIKERTKIIKINGNIYVGTGAEAKVEYTFNDGTITSQVGEKEVPQNDNESNFGIGMEYKFYGEDVLVYIDGTYYIFRKR